jgi:Pregnancy-associated plasma protein-A
MRKLIILIWMALALPLSIISQDFHYSKERSLPCINKTFMVNVHIVKDSLGKPIVTTDEVSAILAKANKAFAPICVSFDYCDYDYVEDYAYLHIDDATEIRLLTSRFHNRRRINLYIVESYFEANKNSYSVHNGITSERDGVIILPKDGIGIEHELGHLFGLYHTFETKFGVELVNGSNCSTAGDRICDTPADPNILVDPKVCDFKYSKPDANMDQYRTEIGNFMSHAFCAHCFFTPDQYEAMANTFINSSFKMW